MKNSLILFLFLACQFELFGQVNPGNVGTTNLTAWFKPDALPLGNVTSWSTTYPVGAVTLTESGGAFPTAVNTPVNASSNYNTTVDFSGNTTGAGMKALENNSTFNLIDNNSVGNQGTFFCVYYLPTAQTGAGHMVTYRESSTGSTDGIQLRTSLGGTTGRIAIGANTNSVNAADDWQEEFRPSIIGYQGNRTGTSTMTSYKRSKTFTGGIASGTTGYTGLRFGAQATGSSTYTGLYTGFVSEVIFYNTDLNALQLAKVNTYLAVKYGITLDNTGGGTQGDYVATNGTIIWDADDSANYHNDVIGIGRDDAQGLLQKQSHAFDDSIRIYIDQLSTTNVGNLGLFTNDVSYLLMGRDTMRSCATQAANSEVPSGVITRLEREFKVTKTNFDQNFSWDIRIDTCTNIDFTMQPQNVRLLVDADGDFTNATVFSDVDGLTFSVIDGTLTIAGITSAMVPNDSTTFLTIGYNDVLVSLQAPSAICAGDDATFTFGVVGTSNPVAITYTINGTTTTLPGVTDGQTFTVPNPTATITYSIEPFVNLLNCCGSGAQDMTLTVNPLPTVVANANPGSICQGDSTQLVGSGAVNYVWDNGVIDAEYFIPAGTQLYTVTGTDANGCVNTDQVTITVNPTPVVAINATDTDICENETVTLTASGATSYQWDNGVVNGTAFTPASTLTYEVVGYNGVCTDTATITITVNANPVVGASASSNPICEGESVILTGTGADTYIWDNGAIDGQTIFPTSTTQYEVNGTNAAGCTSNATVNVIVNPLPVFELGEDVKICPDDSITIGTTDSGNNYFWNTGAATSEITVNQIGLYTLIVTDANGCLFTDDIYVDLFPSCNELIVPNVFTPNGDFSNDFFTIEGTEDLISYHLVIQNRWGNVVFETTDKFQFWNGYNRMTGALCDEGVYFYIVEYQLPQEENLSTQQGFLHLEK